MNNFTRSENTDQPTTGAATKFGELEPVKGQQETARENIKNEIDDLMRDIPSPPRVEISEGLLKVLNDAENIINNDFCKNKRFR